MNKDFWRSVPILREFSVAIISYRRCGLTRGCFWGEFDEEYLANRWVSASLNILNSTEKSVDTLWNTMKLNFDAHAGLWSFRKIISMKSWWNGTTRPNLKIFSSQGFKSSGWTIMELPTRTESRLCWFITGPLYDHSTLRGHFSCDFALADLRMEPLFAMQISSVNLRSSCHGACISESNISGGNRWASGTSNRGKIFLGKISAQIRRNWSSKQPRR